MAHRRGLGCCYSNRFSPVATRKLLFLPGWSTSWTMAANRAARISRSVNIGWTTQVYIVIRKNHASITCQSCESHVEIITPQTCKGGQDNRKFVVCSTSAPW